MVLSNSKQPPLMRMQSWLSTFRPNTSNSPIVLAPPLPICREPETRTPAENFPTQLLADLLDNPATECQTQTVATKSLVVSVVICRWLRSVKQRLASSTAMRRRTRRPWSLACFNSFERLEARVCLAADPTANAGGPYNISAGDTLMLNGSASMSDMSDPDNPPGTMYYAWVLNGTSVTGDAMVSIPWLPNPFDPTAQSLTGTFGFAKGVTANIYNVNLAVTDSNANDGDATTVTVAANCDPVPYISSSNGVNADDEIHIHAYDSLNLDGSATMDSDAFDTLTYSWDILDDGTIEFSGQAQALQTITWDDLVSDYGFAVGGMYPVSLTVNDGYVDRTTSVTVFVDNTGPTAHAIGFVPGGCYDIYVGEALDLDASLSSDPDGAPSPLTFTWDLDNDGVFNYGPFGPTTSVPWATFASLVGYTSGAQSYQIAVKVSDGDTDLDATATVNVNLPIIGVEFVDGTMSEKKSPTPQDNGSFRIYRVTPPFRTSPPNGVAITNISFTLPGSEGFAKNGDDYNTITTSGWGIAAGADEVVIQILVVPDTIPESYPTNLESDVAQPHCEFVDVSLNPSPGDYVIDPMAVVAAHSKIVDNDRWDWDNSSDTAGPLTDSKGVTGYDHLIDSGTSLLSYTATIVRTKNLITVDLYGTFSDPLAFGFGTDEYVVNGYGVGIGFKVSDYGEIELDSAVSSSHTTMPDGPLQGGVPAEYQISNTALSRTAKVRFKGIGVVVDGTVTPVSAAFGWSSVSGPSAELQYTHASTGDKLEMPAWEAAFSLKVVELP